MIPTANPGAHYLRHKDEIDTALLNLLNSGKYVLGAEVGEFENEFAKYVGVKHAIGVASGTDALHLVLTGCGIGPGDEVITVAHTAVATVAAIEMAGALPVVVDIDPNSYTIDPNQVESMITRKTKAILPVHLYGHPADLASLNSIAERHDIALIEDCAQAHGARYSGSRVGSWGRAGCFSFYPTKNLGAIGDGGMVVTNDTRLAERVRLLREYGWVDRISQFPGWSSRLDALQASILRVKLRHLDEANAERAALAVAYNKLLQDTSVTLPEIVEGTDHVFHLFVARINSRDLLRNFLRERGVDSMVHYPVPVHLQPAYSGRLPGSSNLPVTERITSEIISLPMYPELELAHVETVSTAIRDFLDHHSRQTG